MSARMSGVASLRRKLVGLSAEEERAAAREVRRALLNIQRSAKESVRVDRGGLRNSIATEIDPPKGLSGRVGTNSKYGPATEFGRKPGSFPPLDEIRKWAKRKGIPEEAAFPIARKIAEEGIEEAPFLFPAFEEERPAFVGRLISAINDANRKVARR